MAEPRTSITDAPDAASRDASKRTKRYLIMMGIRVVCIMTAFLIPGWPKWVVIAAAAILPGIAVLVANQPNRRKIASSQAQDEGSDRPQLSDGSYDVVPGELDETSEPPSHVSRSTPQDDPAPHTS
ncbi:DUF3099 domain-containing protein [Propionibacteriaceae bacterium Y2011]